jgi:hypothetical protein
VDGRWWTSTATATWPVRLTRPKYGPLQRPGPEIWFGLRQPDGSFRAWAWTASTTQRSSSTAKGAQNHAWSDIDHDGDLDLLVGGRDGGGGRPNFLFRNDLGHQNRALAIRVKGDGVKVNRDGIGTR